VERLESLIANGKKLPLTTNVVVDQNAALGLIDELRVAVPEEVRAAKRINAEGERIIEKAQDEAERIVARAQEQAAFLIDERGLTQSAEAQSREIIGGAHRDADGIRHGADEYAVGVLVSLEADVTKTLLSIQKGIELLDERRASLSGMDTGEGTGDERAVDETGEPSHSTR
jgi:cell division septum initiation protein DivIVA